jgi:hypothetical protein
MAASRYGKLAGDGREDGFDLITKPEQNRDRDHGNKSQNQRVFDESLTFLILSVAPVK